ncbi:MAG: hypothetical protein V2A53_09420 [bacterium]
MQTNTQQRSTVFNKPAFIPTNKIMIVNKSRILEMILKLKGEKSLSLLRSSVLYLKQQLANTKSDKIGLLNIDSNGDTISN